MATSDTDRDDFITPLPDDERTPPEGVHLRDTPTVEFCPPTPPPVAGRPMTFDPRWRTETVVALARGIDADAAFDRLPILADALEEAGCDHPQLLHHCRTCPHPYACCWVVNVVLDRVPGELPPVEETFSIPAEELERVNERLVPPSWPHVPTGWRGRLLRGILIACVVFTAVRLVFFMFLDTPRPAPATVATSSLPQQSELGSQGP